MSIATFTLLILSIFSLGFIYNQPLVLLGAIVSSPVTIVALLISFIYVDSKYKKVTRELAKIRVEIKNDQDKTM